MEEEHDSLSDCGDTDYTYETTFRGYIRDENRPSITVPIFQTEGVSDRDAIIATEKIKTGYISLDNISKNSLWLAKNFLKIEIVTGELDSFNPETGIVKIALETEITIPQIFQFVVIPKLIPK